jgi:hypothetical protein
VVGTEDADTTGTTVRESGNYEIAFGICWDSLAKRFFPPVEIIFA